MTASAPLLLAAECAVNRMRWRRRIGGRGFPVADPRRRRVAFAGGFGLERIGQIVNRFAMRASDGTIATRSAIVYINENLASSFGFWFSLQFQPKHCAAR